MCLLYGLLELGYRQLTICHLNHQLRGRAAKIDESFVTYQAKKLGVSLKVARAQTEQFASDRGFCIEMAGRELRYAFFAKVAKDINCSTLLLAHHANDQLETCWINFLRGTGIAGLAGMRRESIHQVNMERVHGGTTLRVVRPMLKILHSDIVQFTSKWKVPFQEDCTNQDINLMRNRIRHELLPFLDKQFGSTYRNAILRCSEILADEEDWMREVTDQFSCEAQLAYKGIRTLHRALQRRILRRWLVKQEVSDVGFAEVERIRGLVIHPYSRPAKVNLPAGIHVRRRSGMLFLERPKNTELQKPLG